MALYVVKNMGVAGIFFAQGVQNILHIFHHDSSYHKQQKSGEGYPLSQNFLIRFLEISQVILVVAGGLDRWTPWPATPCLKLLITTFHVAITTVAFSAAVCHPTDFTKL